MAKLMDSLKNKLLSPICRHTLIGALIGYFVLHPLTMVIYQFEFHYDDISFAQNIVKALQHSFASFSPHMVSMSILFILIGGGIGITYGFFVRTITEKNIELEKKERQLKMQILLMEKQATLGIMASSIGHEINNALTVIRGYSQILQMKKDVFSRFHEELDRIISSTSTLEALSHTLLNLGKPTPPTTNVVDLQNILDITADTLKTVGVLKRVQIEKKYSQEKTAVVCDPFMLEQVIRNILINAAHAMDGEGKLFLETGIYPGNKSVYLKIRDSGPGIPEQYLTKIFEPFFTTKDESRGTGLGLSIARQIVEQYGGKISVKNIDEGGAEFEIILPSLTSHSQNYKQASSFP